MEALSRLDVSRPVVLVTARVSLEEIDYASLPADAYVFREGDVAAEDHYWFGREIAAWFVPPRQAALQKVRTTAYRGDYEIGAVLTDLRRAQQLVAHTLEGMVRDGQVEDWADYLVRDRATAEILADPHPPSMLTVMLGTALSLGFERLVVLDGQTDGTYVGKIRRSILTEDAVGAGLRSTSRVAYSYELGHLKRLRDAYPQASIVDGAASEPLKQFVSHAPEADGARMTPEAKPGADLAATGDQRLYARRRTPAGERRVAYVTYFDDDGYFWGALAMARSLAKVSSYPLLALVPAGYRIPDVPFLPENLVVVRAPRIRNELFGGRHQGRFEYTFSKLGVFALTFLDRGVYLDADTVVLDGLDELFDRDGFSAAPDFGFTLHREIFNSGVFAFTPDADVFRDMMAKNGSLESYDGGDQGFLNSYFPDVDWLDSSYNTLWRMLESNPGVVGLGDVKVLHFVGPKPWNREPELPESLVSLWLDRLGPDYLGYLTLWQLARERARREAASPRDGGPEKVSSARGPARDEAPPPEGDDGDAASPSGKRWLEAQVLMETGRFDEAEAVVRRNLERWPGSVRNLRILAQVQRRRGQRRASAGTYARLATTAGRRAVGIRA
ncbi:glycosyltransferase family protein [Krasilnikoviella flava]|uniref:Glycosyl transferase family 8 n=1 Tax=Krasilnikoviella flava TaxID=526729 RepID=A0A1T5IAJ8_9MICO|nr:hypothetical protein [Krasilnikoviella flava]SKC36194.1 hypothetical protein SAMN04324258_0250 [Krasilnikoviella flava]